MERNAQGTSKGSASVSRNEDARSAGCPRIDKHATAKGRDSQRVRSSGSAAHEIIYNRGLNLTRRPELAADLVQETYLRAYRTFQNFARGTNAKAWLLTILYSVFVSRYRQEQREPDAIAVEEADENYADARSDERAATDDSRLWASEQVHEALLRLPPGFRAVLLMVDVDELSYEEVAAALRCPVGTVRSRLSRARKTLYVELEEFARAHGFMGKDS